MKFTEQLATIICCLVLCLLAACARQPVYPPPALSDGNAVINESGLAPDVSKFFTYPIQGKHVSFFVIKMDEKVISFLDACASCYPHKRGYRSDDGAVTCRYCNMTFSIYKLEKGLGGCYPIRIAGRMEKGKYLIPLAVLQKAARQF